MKELERQKLELEIEKLKTEIKNKRIDSIKIGTQIPLTAILIVLAIIKLLEFQA